MDSTKTSQGIVDRRGRHALGQWRLPGCGADLGVPELSPGDAAKRGARTFVVGAVSPGGVAPIVGTLLA